MSRCVKIHAMKTNQLTGICMFNCRTENGQWDNDSKIGENFSQCQGNQVFLKHLIGHRTRHFAGELYSSLAIQHTLRNCTVYETTRKSAA